MQKGLELNKINKPCTSKRIDDEIKVAVSQTKVIPAVIEYYITYEISLQYVAPKLYIINTTQIGDNYVFQLLHSSTRCLSTNEL